MKGIRQGCNICYHHSSRKEVSVEHSAWAVMGYVLIMLSIKKDLKLQAQSLAHILFLLSLPLPPTQVTAANSYIRE